VILDFVQWSVHNLLHRSNFLWKIHQVHHSVKDGEMDWIVSFRFSWIEPVIYKFFMFIPLIWFGFSPEALFFHAVFGTLIGHLNHANLTWDYGLLRYVLNTPRMHLYHHAYDAPASGQNFGIILSCWDWIFSTAHLPDAPCPKIGFPGVKEVPNDFFAQMIWPLPLLISPLKSKRILSSTAGVVVLALLAMASAPPMINTPMFNEPLASSQPTAQERTHVVHAHSPEMAARALHRMGDFAKALNWAHPQSAVSAVELAEALGSERLVILDVRTPERFALGHIPSAQLVQRSDYSGGSIPGVSFDAPRLREMLRARGVDQDSVIVVMGDGGPEPYRLHWTLEQVAGVQTRVLNGGLAAWKAIGERLAEGGGTARTTGDIAISEGGNYALMWAGIIELKELHAPLQFLDTRTLKEFTGATTHPKAKRAGHIPDAHFLSWTDVLELKSDVPVLKSPQEILRTARQAGVDPARPLVTYCQSGTRSSAVYYALRQAGVPSKYLWNYDGSWAEYTRLNLPVSLTHPNR
jgi:3-mercaptopyruvate sulfurtransferase SseA